MKTRETQLGEPGHTHFYHVVSRMNGREIVFGDAEREHFRKCLDLQLAFSGLKCVAWCFMGNHFHLLLEVPDKETSLEGWTDDDLIERLRALSSEKYTRMVLADVKMWRENGNAEAVAKVADSVRARLFDLSRFMWEFKRRFSLWFNRNHRRCGTLWEERFRSTLVERGEALRAVAAYIDLNPVRAGIVDDPKDYRWSSYGAAVAGDADAREGLRMAVGEETGVTWRKVGARYRILLYDKGEARSGGMAPDGIQVERRGFSREEIEEMLRRSGRLPLGAALRCRVRYFTEGVALGSEEFVEQFFESRRDSGLFGPKRTRGSRKMRVAKWGNLRVMRDLTDPVSASSE